MPLTQLPNETVAAYIYFDGREKEEVATLLRRGEETWVNSRWVRLPFSQGGGLAEREFLFREVGLERWLNGLDLDSNKDIASKVAKTKKRLAKRSTQRESLDSDEDADEDRIKMEDAQEAEHDEETDSDSEDEAPVSGQIKVALFRVLASGDVKRGEYSPQHTLQRGRRPSDEERWTGCCRGRSHDQLCAAQVAGSPFHQHTDGHGA